MELSFCNFIISLGAILFNKGLILLEEQNQTAPVVNAFFQYLNNSSNATETKIHLLDEVRKSDPNIGGDTLDTKNINETYKKIINMGFDSYGGIAEYFTKLSKETPITTLLVFKERVLKHLSENNIQNSCSSKNGTSGLSALAIEKLSNYLWPYFVKQTTGRDSKDKQKREVEVLKRYKRQVYSDSDDEGMKFHNDLPRTLDIFNRPEDAGINRMLPVSIGNVPSTSKESRKLRSSLEDRAHRRNDSKKPKYFWDLDELRDIQNSYRDIYDYPSTSKQSSSTNEVVDTISDNANREFYNDNPMFHEISNIQEDTGNRQLINLSKTKRIWSIEKAALEISKRNCHNYNYNGSLNLLKGYFLSPNENINSLPTYNKFVDDFCKDSKLTYKLYNKWTIPKHRLIDEVLFQPHFHEMDTKEVLQRFRQIVRNSVRTKEAFELYKNSSVLQGYLSIQDFLLLRTYLEYEKKIDMEVQKRLTFALLRLSLKECETDSLKNNIKIYRFQSFSKLNLDTINDTYPDDTYTFENVTIFSSHKALYETRQKSTWEIEIELENTAGIPNVDLIFKDKGVKGKYLVPSETTFKTIYKGKDLSNPRRYKIIMQDNRSKEGKMIGMIKKMYDLLIKESHLFAYYTE